MKILFDHPFRFCSPMADSRQIEQPKKALEELGVEVEWLRWWDETQKGDIIHFFGRPSHAYVEFAQAKGMKVIMEELLTGLGSRGAAARRLQSSVIRLLRRSFFFDRMGWRAYQLADAAVANTEWEKELMCTVFGAPPERVWVVPNGVEEVFRQGTSGLRTRALAGLHGDHRAPQADRGAGAGRRPGEDALVGGRRTVFRGRSLREGLPAGGGRAPRGIIRYEGGIADRARLAAIYGEARGFVLLSTMETRSLASEEAAACHCPLLLSDLPWARSTFGAHATYCPIADEVATASALRAFYDAAPQLPSPPEPASWKDVAMQFTTVSAVAGCGAVIKMESRN